MASPAKFKNNSQSLRPVTIKQLQDANANPGGDAFVVLDASNREIELGQVKTRKTRPIL